MDWILPPPPPPDPKLLAMASVLEVLAAITFATTCVVAIRAWFTSSTRAERIARFLLGAAIVEGLLLVAWGGQPGTSRVVLPALLLILVGLGLPALSGVAEALGRLIDAVEDRLRDFQDECWFCHRPSPWSRAGADREV